MMITKALGEDRPPPTTNPARTRQYSLRSPVDFDLLVQRYVYDKSFLNILSVFRDMSK